jgi:hypothetical protein
MREVAMRCQKCGVESMPGSTFCARCGERLVIPANSSAFLTPQYDIHQERMQQAAPGGQTSSASTASLVCRIFGGIGWLVVSLGTVMIAMGWLGTIDADYYGDITPSFRLIGYGVITLAASGVFFSVREFVKDPRW